MKSRETLIRLKKFQVDEKRRRVTQIEGMIADFQRMSVDLEREIQTEQERAGINDPTHFAKDLDHVYTLFPLLKADLQHANGLALT